MEEKFTNPTIVQYLEGRMTSEETSAFEAKIAREKELALEVSFYEALLQRRDAALREKMRAARKRPTFYWGRFAKIAAVSAGLLLMALAVWYVRFRPSDVSAVVCGGHYQRLQASDLLSTATDGGQEALSWRRALKAYTAREYDRAAQAAQTLLNQPNYADKANLLTGACAQEQGDPATAIEYYAKVSPSAVLYYGKARLNTAMAYRCQGKLAQAQAALQAILDDPQSAPPLKTSAQKILDDIKDQAHGK